MAIEKVTFQSATPATPPAATEVAVDATPEGSVQVVKLAVATDGSSTLIPATASGLKVDGSAVTQPVSGPLTDAQLRASVVSVDVSDRAARLVGHVTVDNATIAVTGPLTDAQLRASPVPVSGTVTVQDGGNVISVDDAAGSLTVDAPVGTPVFARLSDGAAALIGQKVMASSVPVALASDQSTLPVSLATNTPDVTDRAAREVGRVRIWDGTDEATVTPLRTLPAGGSDKTLNVREIPNRLSTFAVAIATQTPAITVGVKELLALWHVNTGVKDIYIVEIWATAVITTASTAGRTAIRVSNITTAPTGGTALTMLDVVQGGTSDLTNAMQVKTGGGTVGTTFIRKLAEFATNPVGRIEISVFAAANPGNGIILPAGSSAGISIDIEREVAHTALVDLWTVGARWVEI